MGNETLFGIEVNVLPMRVIVEMPVENEHVNHELRSDQIRHSSHGRGRRFCEQCQEDDYLLCLFPPVTHSLPSNKLRLVETRNSSRYVPDLLKGIFSIPFDFRTLVKSTGVYNAILRKTSHLRHLPQVLLRVGICQDRIRSHFRYKMDFFLRLRSRRAIQTNPFPQLNLDEATYSPWLN